MKKDEARQEGRRIKRRKREGEKKTREEDSKNEGKKVSFFPKE